MGCAPETSTSGAAPTEWVSIAIPAKHSSTKTARFFNVSDPFHNSPISLPFIPPAPAGVKAHSALCRRNRRTFQLKPDPVGVE
jgi:hypothetical protein